MNKRNAKPAQPTRLPALDLLVGFEAAARHLSFTKAGEELFLTQSAVSRQIKDLEEQLGVELFERRHRALSLTEAGQQYYASASQVLATMRSATERLRAHARRRQLSVATTASFASLWLVPRLSAFRRLLPDVDVRISAESRFVDLERDGFDVAIRLCTPALAGEGAVRLFGETVFPVAAPELARKLRAPRDLADQVLLELDQQGRTPPWLSWRSWLEVAGIGDLQPQGFMRLSEFDQVYNAALSGTGVALGRSELVREALSSGRLVAPFPGQLSTERAYYVLASRAGAERADVQAFTAWLKRESKRPG